MVRFFQPPWISSVKSLRVTYIVVVELNLGTVNARRPLSSLESIASDIAVGQLQVILARFRLGNLGNLQNVLKQSGAIISGSTALLLLHPGQFDPNDIDFYVLQSSYRVLLTYLQHVTKLTAITPLIMIIRRFAVCVRSRSFVRMSPPGTSTSSSAKDPMCCRRSLASISRS